MIFLKSGDFGGTLFLEGIPFPSLPFLYHGSGHAVTAAVSPGRSKPRFDSGAGVQPAQAGILRKARLSFLSQSGILCFGTAHKGRAGKALESQRIPRKGYPVRYLNRQSTRLITGVILVRVQGGPPDKE